MDVLNDNVGSSIAKPQTLATNESLRTNTKDSLVGSNINWLGRCLPPRRCRRGGAATVILDDLLTFASRTPGQTDLASLRTLGFGEVESALENNHTSNIVCEHRLQLVDVGRVVRLRIAATSDTVCKAFGLANHGVRCHDSEKCHKGADDRNTKFHVFEQKKETGALTDFEET